MIDARIAEAYISGEDLERYKDDWVYYCFGRQSVFESPAPENRGWVSPAAVRFGWLSGSLTSVMPWYWNMTDSLVWYLIEFSFRRAR